MKRCPECRRDYYDDTLLYCLDDGTALLEGPATGESKTQTLPHVDIPGESATKPQISGTSETSSNKPNSSSDLLITEIRGHKTVALLASIIVLFVVAGFVYGLYRLLKDPGGQTQTTNKSAALNMKALTASGNIREAAISPDGKFLAYTENTDTGAGLWTKQIATNSNVQIAPTTIYDYFALQFSPDGQYVYYGQFEQGPGTIYRVATLGSTRIKVVSNVDGQISFSPDGKQFVVERFSMAPSGESDLVIVNSDGSGERTLASRFGHQYFSSPSPSWSPDGKMIACSLGDDTIEHEQTMGVVDVADGSIKELGKTRFDGVAHTAWEKDQSGILLIASDKGANMPYQIWEVSYATGEARQLTHDLPGYVYLSLTADGKTMVAVQRDTFGGVWFSTNGDINKAQQISRGKHEGNEGMTLLPDGRIVYVSTISGATEIWAMNSDGSSAKQLTYDGLSKYTPTVTSDGRYIVYILEKAGRHLWRINVDGSQPIQLADADAANPRTSPDGNWVVYDSFRNGKQQLVWRIPIQGGEPLQVTDFAATESDVSPDGKYIACFFVDEQGDNKWRMAVVPFEGGKPVKTFDLPQTVSVDNSPMWTPDGKGITYIDWVGSASNLWVQPFDGGQAKQLTNYKQGYIYRREWTKGGKQIAIVRGSETSDAVMITDFK